MTDDDDTPTPVTVPAMPVVVSESPSGSRRVPPNPNKPSIMGPKRRRILAEADQKAAEGYDALEDAGTLVAKITDAIDTGKVEVELVMDESVIRDIRKI